MGYIERFIEILLKSSKSKDYETAIQEWVYQGGNFHDSSHCICGHEIFENCPVSNRENGNTLIIGNCCIKKFSITREHYNKSRKLYLEYALGKAHNIPSRQFIQDLIAALEKYGSLHMSAKQFNWLLRIAGVPYRWDWKWKKEREV